jgi:hypothetical protein
MTRSETSDIREKSLNHVLRRGDQFAVILDDREEVWAKSIENLLPVKAYDFFKGHGTPLSKCVFVFIYFAYYLNILMV